MKQLLKLAVLSASVLIASAAMAEDVASTSAKDDVLTTKGADTIIAKGKVGQAPVQLIYDYLADRISNEYGVSEYKTLQINQQAAGAEQFNKVSVEVIQSGLMDDALTVQRYRFALEVNEAAQIWQIKSVVQDWQCQRGKKKTWTQKPCK